jgi:hypothetical protein
MTPLVRGLSGAWFHRDPDRELAWEQCLLESLRLTSRNQARQLLDASGLELYSKQIDELVVWVLKTPMLCEHVARRGFAVTAIENNLLRHSTAYAFLTLLSRSDPAGVIRVRLRESCTSTQAWRDAEPVALDDQSRYWLASLIMWLFAAWMLDDVIDSNLQVDPCLYTATSRVLVDLWDPLFLCEHMREARQQMLDELRCLWRSHGVGERDAQLISTSMLTFLMCYESLAHAGFSPEESGLVCNWTTGFLESLPSVREALLSLANRQCSFEQFVAARQPNTAVDLPILFLLLWYGRALGIAPERICRVANQLHPTQGNYRGWIRDAMIISGIGNDLVDVRRDLPVNAMNTVLCVYGAMHRKNPFEAAAQDAEGLRGAYRNVAGRFNDMLDAMLLDLRTELEAARRGQSALFHTREEMLAVVAALVDICFATVYSGFVCPRHREGAMELVDALSAAPHEQAAGRTLPRSAREVVCDLSMASGDRQHAVTTPLDREP